MIAVKSYQLISFTAQGFRLNWRSIKHVLFSSFHMYNVVLIFIHTLPIPCSFIFSYNLICIIVSSKLYLVYDLHKQILVVPQQEQRNLDPIHGYTMMWSLILPVVVLGQDTSNTFTASICCQHTLSHTCTQTNMATAAAATPETFLLPKFSVSGHGAKMWHTRCDNFLCLWSRRW